MRPSASRRCCSNRDPRRLAIDFVEQHVQRGTGDAAGIALTAFPDDDARRRRRRHRAPRRHAASTPRRRLPRSVAGTPRRRRRSHIAHRPPRRPQSATAASIRGRDGGGACGWSSKATRRRASCTIDEVNTSIYCFQRSVLAPALRRLSPDNNQGEYYLTDVVEVLHDAGYRRGLGRGRRRQARPHGVNDRVQLAAAEAELRRRTNDALAAPGRDHARPRRAPTSTPRCELDADVTLFPGTMLQGRTVIGAGRAIGPAVRLVDCMVGARRGD